MSYHTPQSINSLFQPFDNETKIFLIHFNCISLQKNVDKLRLYLDNLAYKPDIIMVSETNLKGDSLLINIEIKGYIFFHADSITNAGGVGIYIKCKFNPCIYDDVSQIHGSEYIFIKLRLKTSDYVFGVVYRHPTYSSENFLEFENSFNDVIEHLNSSALQYYTAGDFNIDLLKYMIDSKIKAYADMLLSIYADIL